jgi:hypothetical protein
MLILHVSKTTRLQRYPDEDCMENHDCYSDKKDKLLGKCVDNKCSGHPENDICIGDQSCLKGLYCDENTTTCQKQKPLNAECSSSFECINSLLCHENSCKLKPLALPLGSSYMTHDPFFPSLKCVLGLAFGNICSSLNQTDTSQIYIPCEMNQYCNFLP